MKKGSPFKRHTGFSLPSLMLSFGAATGLFDTLHAAETNAPPPIPPDPVTQAVEMPLRRDSTYWKHPEYGAVMEVWTDPEKGLRGRLVSLDATDEKVREVVGKILKKKTEKVTDDDINGFVGMEGDLTLQQLGENHWKGSIYWPYKQKSYGVEVKQEDGNLHVRGFFLRFPILGKEVDLKPAAAPKP